MDPAIWQDQIAPTASSVSSRQDAEGHVITLDILGDRGCPPKA
jgi:hypothetical protein